MRKLSIVLVACLLTASCTASDVRLPAFAWGSSEYVQPGPSPRRVVYQSESTALLETLVSGVLGESSLSATAERWFRTGSAKPAVTIIFFGRKVDAANADQLTHLHAALDAAPASVSLPYMHHAGGDSLQARLTAAAAADAGVTVHRVGSCEGAAAAPLQDHQLPSLGGGGGNDVVLVCPGAQDTLEDEAAVLNALREAVAEAEARHLFIYASEPEAGGQRRTLLARSAKKGAAGGEDASPPSPGKAPPAPAPPGQRVCDAKCKTQVNQLEAAILLFTLLVALGFGIYCMGILDAPTRFESVKDENR